MTKYHQEICERLLDDVLCVDDRFNYQLALLRLKTMQENNNIGVVEYLELVDAANTYNETGSYVGSRIMKRALASK